MILKSNLKRSSMDNITCVMLTFEGFEKKYLESKEKPEINKDNISSLSSNSDMNKTQKDDKKLANGMVKKPQLSLSLNKNMTTSIVSADLRESSTPVQLIPSSTTNKSNKFIETLKQGLSVQTVQPVLNQISEPILQLRSKLKEDKKMTHTQTQSNIPSTVKNHQKNKIIFPK